MTQSSTVKSLKFASTFCIAIGLVMVAAVLPPFSSVLGFFADLAFLPLDQAQSVTTDTEKLLLAISGGLLVGFGAFTWQISTHIYPSNPALGSRILMIGIFAWFIPDSLGSIAAGAWFNVVMNTGFVVLFGLPLLQAKRQPSGTETA